VVQAELEPVRKVQSTAASWPISVANADDTGDRFLG
jgi:hypothetical protein